MSATFMRENLDEIEDPESEDELPDLERSRSPNPCFDQPPLGQNQTYPDLIALVTV